MERDSRKRAEALLAQMTATEKVGQLNQHLYGFRIYHVEDGKIIFTQELKDEVKKWGGIGTIYGLYRADPWSEKNYETGLAGGLSMQAYNQLQKYVIEHSRLGIPFLLSSECPHGHQALDGYLLPVNLAVGASFDPALYERAGQVCGRQLKQMGVDFALVSALDILRDPRWGRSEECYGEDPYLSAELARAIVTGIQKEGVAVVAKHFCAQGETTGGVNASAARIGERELWEIHLQSAKACCEAGVKGIMAAYNEIDGKFCHANRHLLQDILREQLGFDGVVMADGIAIDQLDIMTGDNIRSAALALKAGVDISLWDEGYTKLEEALKQGFITEKELDQAVLRVLTLKFEQGLMDKPYIDENGNRTASYSENGAVSFPTEAYQESEKLARESVVLLKNENVLPIGRAEKIALIGPNADDIYRQIGDYSPPMDRAGYETLKSGMEKEFGADRVRCYNGHEVGTAVSLAENADIIVLALGGSSSRFKGALFDENGAAKVQGVLEMDCGEGMDTARLQLPGNQNELFTAVCALKKPVISVVIAGRPYAIPEIAQDSDALLYAFYPGPMGGKAIAELLSGKYAPSGRLPVSLPRNCGQLPVYYNHTVSYPAMHYCDMEQGVLYTFGEGMGYSHMEYVDICLKKQQDVWIISGIVKNKGNIDDTAVLQCYRKVLSGELVPRERELVAFSRIKVEKGGQKAFEIVMDADKFRYFNESGAKIYKSKILLMDSGILTAGGENYVFITKAKNNQRTGRTDAALPQHTYCDDKRGGRDRDACSKKTAGGDQAGNGAYPAVFRRGSKGGGSLSWDRKNITRADI